MGEIDDLVSAFGTLLAVGFLLAFPIIFFGRVLGIF